MSTVQPVLAQLVEHATVEVKRQALVAIAWSLVRFRQTGYFLFPRACKKPGLKGLILVETHTPYTFITFLCRNLNF